MPRFTFRFVATACIGALLAACGGGNDHHNEQQRAETARRLDQAATTTLAQNPTWPGVAAYAIVDDVALTWRTGLGEADTTTRRPLAADATFRIASVTKAFTAAAIYRLMEMHQLGIADPIERHLQPATLAALRGGGYDTQGISVDHLLAHTSGLRDFATSAEYVVAVVGDPAHRWSRDEQLAIAMSLGAPLAAPGAAHFYSDTGYILLGEIIESKTGLALGAAFRSLLKLDALGLRATWQETIDPVPAGAGARARQYIEPGVDATALDASTDLWGGGGLVSDTHDLAVFVRALLTGHVLGPAALAQMKLVTDAAAARAPARGLFRLRVRGDDCWGHDGIWGAVALHCVQHGITVAATIDMSPLGLTPGSDVDAFELAARLVASAMEP